MPCFVEIPVFNPNNVDSDQALHSDLSNFILHFSDMPPFGDARPLYVLVTISSVKTKGEAIENSVDLDEVVRCESSREDLHFMILTDTSICNNGSIHPQRVKRLRHKLRGEMISLENTPIQLHLTFHLQKLKVFS